MRKAKVNRTKVRKDQKTKRPTNLLNKRQRCKPRVHALQLLVNLLVAITETNSGVPPGQVGGDGVRRLRGETCSQGGGDWFDGHVGCCRRIIVVVCGDVGEVLVLTSECWMGE